MTQQPIQFLEIGNWLRARAQELNARLQAIRADQARTREPLSLDSADRATERENDDVVDAIGMSAESELRSVEAALERIAAGTFGRCLTCSSSIPEERLRAIPYATCCAGCTSLAQENST